MTEKKRYTVILRGDIRVEVESDENLCLQFGSFVVADGVLLESGEDSYCFRLSDVVAVLESSAITTTTYEPVVQTEESEFEASERARKERGE